MKDKKHGEAIIVEWERKPPRPQGRRPKRAQRGELEYYDRYNHKYVYVKLMTGDYLIGKLHTSHQTRFDVLIEVGEKEVEHMERQGLPHPKIPEGKETARILLPKHSILFLYEVEGELG